MDFAKVQAIITRHDPRPYRMKQVKNAVFLDLVSDWDQISTLPKALREELKREVPLCSLTLVRRMDSGRDDCSKFAFKLHDGNLIESVLMRHKDSRNTLCISSQAGCAMRCAFCATGKMGLKRNLTQEEILDQILFVDRLLHAEGQRIKNIVVMGMGEPMQNYDNVIGVLRMLNDKDGLNISARRMTISTCGVVPGILRLADEPEQFNLAISLHAPNDETRNKIMPVNKAYPVKKLMDAVRVYQEKTNRKVFFEYLMLAGINDTPEIADELAVMLKGPLNHLNLIKYHSTGEFNTTERAKRFDFKKRVQEQGVIVTHRISYGEDIDAACGQLANKTEKKSFAVIPR